MRAPAPDPAPLATAVATAADADDDAVGAAAPGGSSEQPDTAADAVDEAAADEADEDATDAAAGLSTADRLMNHQFFEHLGISDTKQLSFVAKTLHTAYEAIFKLDTNLAPYGASLHCAVSRMIVPTNPEEAPTHRWIRDLDRLGFFADGDEHAERIINVGLSFAYRHLEVDALVGANVALLEKRRTSTALSSGTVVGREGAVRGADAAAADAVHGRGEQDVPVGGVAIARGGIVFPNASAGVARDGAASAAGSATAGGDASTVPPGGDILWRHAAGGRAGRAANEDQDKLDDDEDDNDAGRDTARPHLIFERQPAVKPSATAVQTVKAVLLAVGDRADAIVVLRQLLRDSVLRLALTAPDAASAGQTLPTSRAAGKADWAAITSLTKVWWLMWVAPQDHKTAVPPDGTMAAVQNQVRPARTSRWGVRVDMSGVIPTVQQLAVKARRFFRKDELPEEETVIRMFGKKGLRLHVVVASMLLLTNKEERYGAILTGMSFPGRAAIPQATPLSHASLHEFSSAGLSAGPPQLAPRSTSSTGATTAPPIRDTSGAAVPGDDQLGDLSLQVADMDARLHQEGVTRAAQTRAHRLQVRRARGRPPAAPPGHPTPLGPTSPSLTIPYFPLGAPSPPSVPLAGPHLSPVVPAAAGL